MSVTNCLGNALYLVEAEIGYEVHVILSDELFKHASQLKDIVNYQLNRTGIHIDISLFSDTKLMQCDSSVISVKWDRLDAGLVLDAIKISLPIFENKVRFEKAVRIFREEYNQYFNVCTDFDEALKKIEELRTVLHS